MTHAMLARVLLVLGELLFETCHAQRVACHAETRERRVDHDRRRPLAKLQPYVVVHRVQEALVEAAELEQRLAAHECGRRRNEVLCEEEWERPASEQRVLVARD